MNRVVASQHVLLLVIYYQLMNLAQPENDDMTQNLKF